MESGCLSTQRDGGTEQDVFICSYTYPFIHFTTEQLKGDLNKVKRG